MGRALQRAVKRCRRAGRYSESTNVSFAPNLCVLMTGYAVLSLVQIVPRVESLAYASFLDR